MLQGLLVQVLPIIHTSIYEERVHQSMELQRLQSWWWRLLHIANLAFIKCYLCYAICRLQVHNILWKKILKLSSESQKDCILFFSIILTTFLRSNELHFTFYLLATTYLTLQNEFRHHVLTTRFYTSTYGITLWPKSSKKFGKYYR